MSPFLLRRLSDERLSDRLASGEAIAFDELYRRYIHRLAAYGAHLLGDRAAGEDVAQVALLKAYQSLRGGRAPDRVRPWLYRIAHNVAIDTLARRRELLRPEQVDGRTVDPHEGSAFRGALIAALADLPERQRRTYVLRELRGLRIAEIADELELTNAQVEQALFAARNRLAELITFGERLTCDVVGRLSEGELSAHERKALRAHLRTCHDCGTAVGRRRARAFGLLPVPSFEWLRHADGLLFGGGAGGASAVEIGALVATATVAAGVPLAAHEEPTRHPPAAKAAVMPQARSALPANSAAQTARAARTSASVAEHVDRPAASETRASGRDGGRQNQRSSGRRDDVRENREGRGREAEPARDSASTTSRSEDRGGDSTTGSGPADVTETGTSSGPGSDPGGGSGGGSGSGPEGTTSTSGPVDSSGPGGEVAPAASTDSSGLDSSGPDGGGSSGSSGSGPDGGSSGSSGGSSDSGKGGGGGSGDTPDGD